MSGFDIRIEGRAGRLTFRRPKALNALSADMSIAAEQALDAWRDDPAVALIIIDAEGDKAFCAGGDIADLYAHGTQGDFDFGRDFWRQEYGLNLKIADYPKPIVSLMQGFTMGGGVGVGCHASHRIVGETSKMAMPECGIGLIPDVGGTYLLGQAPDGIGVYYGLTGARMNAADAIHAGFADFFVPQDMWADLVTMLVDTGDADVIRTFATDAGAAPQTAAFAQMVTCFDGETVEDIVDALRLRANDTATKALTAITRGSPIALACALVMIRAAGSSTLCDALRAEYRFAHRSQDQADFLEGIRAQIIDKDFAPKWRHAFGSVPALEISELLAPLGALEWKP